MVYEFSPQGSLKYITSCEVLRVKVTTLGKRMTYIYIYGPVVKVVSYNYRVVSKGEPTQLRSF